MCTQDHSQHPPTSHDLSDVEASEGQPNALENERALNALLRTVTSRASLDSILLECLDILMAVSWLSLLPKGGVFLVQEDAATLQLVAQRRLSSALLSKCALVPFGKCLCGRAAAEKRLIHADCVDARHEIGFIGMKPHGHYNVPILDDGNIAGVMVLYLPEGHAAKQSETRFLTAVADILSLVIRQKRVEENLKEAVAKLERMALVDALTELHNRRHLMDELERHCEDAKRHKTALSVVMIDMDHFKRINDDHGHATGDRVLWQAARVIAATVRTYDVSARYGGEEFCVVLPNTKLCDAAEVAERVRTNLESTAIELADGGSLRFSASLGVAELRSAETPEDALARADAALYTAKGLGRNRVEQAGSLEVDDKNQAPSANLR